MRKPLICKTLPLKYNVFTSMWTSTSRLQHPRLTTLLPNLLTLELERFLHPFAKKLLPFSGCFTYRQVPVLSSRNKSGEIKSSSSISSNFLDDKKGVCLFIYLCNALTVSRTHTFVHVPAQRHSHTRSCRLVSCF